MRVALLTIDSREHYKTYDQSKPAFGSAPEALLQGFARMPDLELHILSCAQQPMVSPKKLAPNIFFHGLHVPRLGWMRTAYQGCIRAIRKELHEIQPDLVHGQGTGARMRPGAVFSGFPNVLTIHGNMANLARLHRARIGSFLWLAARLEDIALRRTSGVLCNSRHTDALVRDRTKRTWLVPNALQESFFAPLPPPSRRMCRILNVGVVSPGKRQADLLDVVQSLHERRCDFEFIFVGHAAASSAYAAAFLKKLAPLAQAGVARYVGLKPTDELLGLFDNSAALVHVSVEESFGLVVAEALARGLKVFASRVGGVVDIAETVPGAELFSRDDWDGLAAAIEAWITAGHVRSSSAVEVMRSRYHPDIISRRHMEIYRELLSGA